MTPELITPYEFIEFERTNSRAIPNEWLHCIEPKFTKYQVTLSAFLSDDVFPTYRLDKSGANLTSVFQDKEARPISFLCLAKCPDLIGGLLEEGYISTNQMMLVYHCEMCGVHVVKDGIHRLCKWAVEEVDREITVYQVSSRDWSNAYIDMPNYCRCLAA
jgi:hypothetical protein